MAEYLNNLKTSSEINDLIENSNEFLYLISPYLNLSQVFKTSIKRVDTGEVDFSIVYRSGESNISEDDSNFFSDNSGINLLKCDNLHAKCYLNESFGIITSLNLFEHSQTHNHEMGVKFSKKDDQELYEKALKDARLIIDESLVVIDNDLKTKESRKNNLSNKNRSIPQKLKQAPKKGLLESVGDLILGDHGFCIRCGHEIDFDNSKPFCGKCFASWSRYKNSEYSEKYCHKCGKKVKTTKSKPICKDCYNKYYRDL
jgi:hypothetical protein